MDWPNRVARNLEIQCNIALLLRGFWLCNNGLEPRERREDNARSMIKFGFHESSSSSNASNTQFKIWCIMDIQCEDLVYVSIMFSFSDYRYLLCSLFLISSSKVPYYHNSGLDIAAILWKCWINQVSNRLYFLFWLGNRLQKTLEQNCKKNRRETSLEVFQVVTFSAENT